MAAFTKVFIAVLLFTPFAQAITFREIQPKPTHLNLVFEVKKGEFTNVADPDGRVLILTLYSEIMDPLINRIYKAPKVWGTLQKQILMNWHVYRPLFRKAGELFVERNPGTEATSEMNIILAKPWIKGETSPTLNEFSNQTIGRWLYLYCDGFKTQFKNQKNMARTLPLFLNDTREPVNQYWISRPLKMPPKYVLRDQRHLRVTPQVFSAKF